MRIALFICLAINSHVGVSVYFKLNLAHHCLIEEIPAHQHVVGVVIFSEIHTCFDFFIRPVVYHSLPSRFSQTS